MFKQLLVGVLSVGLMSSSYAHHDQADEVQKSWIRDFKLMCILEKVSIGLSTVCAMPGVIAGLCLAVSPFLNKQTQPIINTKFAKDVFFESAIVSGLFFMSWIHYNQIKWLTRRIIQAYGYANDPELQPYL